MTIDPITLEVVCEGLRAIGREMYATIIRTAYSSVIALAHDFSCAIFDRAGQLIAQSGGTAGHVIPIALSIERIMQAFQNDLAPGDIILLNDPYQGGTHLNDVLMAYPVFDGDDLFIFPAIRAHWVDIGGATPGSISGLSTSIHQEGLRIPPIKICERGVFNRAAMDLIFSNVRMPEGRMGDFYACLGACKTAEQRIRERLKRYGKETILRCIELNLDRSEQRMREQIARIPPGEYCYEDYLEFYEGDGQRLQPVRVALTLKIEGSNVVADFTGSSPQVAGVVNASQAVAASGVFIPFKAIFDPDFPMNQGSFRPIKVIAPEGTIVNLQPPAPAAAHVAVRKRCVSAVMGALAQAIPGLIVADQEGIDWHILVGGTHPRTQRPFVFYDFFTGGLGSLADHDGSNVFPSFDQGEIATVQSVEALEQEFPIFIERSSLLADSGGDGRRRGGLGMRRQVRMLSDGTFSLLGERAVIPPYGVFGGGPGLPIAALVIRRGKRHPFKTPGKVANFPLKKGDLLVLDSAGGGGYGGPLEREVERVAADVREGYITPHKAKEMYGAVLDGGVIDRQETARERQRLAGQARRLAVIPWVGKPEGQVGERVGGPRPCRIHPTSLKALGLAASALVELIGRHGAPLRCWLTPEASLPEGSLALESTALKILGINPGEQVVMRAIASGKSGEEHRG